MYCKQSENEFEPPAPAMLLFAPSVGLTILPDGRVSFHCANVKENIRDLNSDYPLRPGEWAHVAGVNDGSKLTLPAADEEAFLARLYAQRTLPRLALPEDLSLDERTGTPAPHLKIGPPAPRTVPWGAPSDRPTAELSFRYTGLPIASGDPRHVIAVVSERRLIRRDRDAEAAAAAKMLDAGFQRAPPQPGEGVGQHHELLGVEAQEHHVGIEQELVCEVGRQFSGLSE